MSELFLFPGDIVVPNGKGLTRGGIIAGLGRERWEMRQIAIITLGSSRVTSSTISNKDAVRLSNRRVRRSRNGSHA